MKGKKAIVWLLIAVLCAGLFSCGKEEKNRYEAEFLTLFDTMTKIVAYMDNKAEFTAYAQMIYDGLEEYHQLYDIYHDYPGINNLKTINDHAGIAQVMVDRKIIDLLLLAKEEYKATEGTMNVAMGSVLRIWHDYREKGQDDPGRAKLPPRAILEDAAAHTSIDAVIIDEEKSTVYLADPKMRLDVGSIAKGYATEQVCQAAEKAGFVSGLVSVGGNVRAIGTKPGGEPWNVGVKDPEETGQTANLVVTFLKEASLVTSGNYERYYIVDGKRYHHIINPKTLYPSDFFASVTIIAKDSGKADALSTAVYNMPLAEGIAYVEGLDGVYAMWVLNNGEIHYSEGFQNHLRPTSG